MNFLPAGGASRSIAPNLVYTSCDGTILAGVFKYSDAIKNPDGNFNYRKRLHPNINVIRFTLCSIKGLFTPKNPTHPPPQNPRLNITPPKTGGGVPPLLKNRPLRQAKFILARLLAPYALTRGLGQKCLWYTPPPDLCKSLGGLL